MNINELVPNKVFKYFHEISQIPHGSGNTKAIAEYCLDFAKKHNLRAIYDKGGNIVIFKDGTKGYENSKPVIIQGHLDMVCEKDSTCTADMAKEPLRLNTDGEWLWAEGTTLGGDDGIAVAYALAILASDDIAHPPLEVLLTRDEETGMFGAAELDPTPLSGKRLINIDSEEEGIFTVGCAGGITAICTLPLSFISTDKPSYKITVSGGKGGHSGVEIHKYRVNAIKLLTNVLNELNLSFDIGISSFSGGGKMNVIPSTASAVIVTDDDIAPTVSKINEKLKKQIFAAEPNINITIESISPCGKCTDTDSTDKLIFALHHSPNAIQSMSADIPGAVCTSLNLGIADIDTDVLKFVFLLRSNSPFELNLLKNKLTSFTKIIGAETKFEGEYPAWEYAPESPLRDTMLKVYKKMYGTEPKIESIHAGLECGILSEKLGCSDIVSIGPDMENIHSPKERLNISSANRVWEFLLNLLKEL